jgi:hypothetical protein
MFTAEPSTYERQDKAVSGIQPIDSETHRLHLRHDSVVQVASST